MLATLGLVLVCTSALSAIIIALLPKAGLQRLERELPDGTTESQLVRVVEIASRHAIPRGVLIALCIVGIITTVVGSVMGAGAKAPADMVALLRLAQEQHGQIVGNLTELARLVEQWTAGDRDSKEQIQRAMQDELESRQKVEAALDRLAATVGRLEVARAGKR